MSSAHHLPPLPLAGLLLAATVGCSQNQGVDPDTYLEAEIARRLSAGLAAEVELPFRLDTAVVEEVKGRFGRAGDERRRADEILDYIFVELDLQYAQEPTRNASETYRERRGNCLSFVNLFVGLARHVGLNAFYVEVEDYQRWSHDEGVVVSRGHIVAGAYLGGELSTFDFLPYRPKAYRDFEPIEDLRAMAHHYNNLGAEALMQGDIERARRRLTVAHELDPTFEKAINNLGLVHLRAGEADRAVSLYRVGLGQHPSSVPLLTNLVRAYQILGREEEAEPLALRLEKINRSNPLFYLYRGHQALADGEPEVALEYMRRALRIDSGLPEVHLGLVRVFLELGRIAEARHHAARARRIDPSDQEVLSYVRLLQLDG